MTVFCLTREISIVINIQLSFDGKRFLASFRGTQRENFGKILELPFSPFLDCFRAL